MSFNFLQATDRSFWYSFDQTQEEERQSQPWGHPAVLNPGPLQSVLPPPPLLSPKRRGGLTSKFEHRTVRIQYLNHQRTYLSVTFLLTTNYCLMQREKKVKVDNTNLQYTCTETYKTQLNYQIIFIFISFLSENLAIFCICYRISISLQHKFLLSFY